MTALRLAGCLAAALAAVLCGCNNSAPQTIDTSGGAYREVPSSTAELVARGQSRIADVPMPMGFDLDESRSRDFAAGGARYVDHVYYGRADKADVARFYRRQMGIPRWVMVTDMFVQGDNILDFEKDGERCRIMVTGGGGLLHPTVIKVQLWTSGRIEAKDSKGIARR